MIVTRTLLSAVTSTGAGTAIEFLEGARQKFTPDASFQVTDTGGASQITVTIEGSNNGTDYVTLATQDVTVDGGIFLLKNSPVVFIRANLTVLTGGTTPTVTVKMYSDDIRRKL